MNVEVSYRRPQQVEAAPQQADSKCDILKQKQVEKIDFVISDLQKQNQTGIVLFFIIVLLFKF